MVYITKNVGLNISKEKNAVMMNLNAPILKELKICTNPK